MRFDIITIFPKLFDAFLKESLIQRAQKKNIVQIYIHNLRDFTSDRHRTVDDTPYGGGPGMIFKPEPVFAAVKKIVQVDSSQSSTNYTPRSFKKRIILLSPQGVTFTQAKGRELAKAYDQIILICGRYEGFDERIRSYLVDEQISIGEYVLQGGEIPAMVVMEVVSRHISGVLGHKDSAIDESFSKKDYIEYPQYTRPENYQGMKVPRVLVQGDHAKINQWRISHARSKNENTTKS